jgi:O-antigen ligase
MLLKAIENKKAIFYLFWICALSAFLIIFPNYLGLLISKNQWSILGILGLGVLIVTLYFSDFRHVIFVAMLFLFFASAKYYWMTELFANLRWVILAAMAARALSNWIMGRVTTRFRWIDLFAFLFLVLAFYSQTYSIRPDLTLERSVSVLIFYLAVFWGVCEYVNDPKKAEVVIQQLLAAAFIVYLWGFCHPNIVGGRIVGFFGSPNAIGVLGSIVFPLALWSYFSRQSRYGGLILLVVVASILMSNSRAGFLGAGIGGAYFLSSYKRSGRTGFLTWFLFLAVLPILCAQLFGAEFFKEFFRWETLLSGSGRYEAWREVLRLISYRPWLGYGFGVEEQLFLTFDIVFYEHNGLYAHNSYIGLISQVGIIGACILFVPLLFFFIREVIRIHRMSEIGTYQLELALNAAILGGVVNALFESWVYSAGSAFAFPFWCVVVMKYRLASQVKNQKIPVKSNKLEFETL